MSGARRAHRAFGQRLRYWRKVRGLSQLALATEAGTTSRHLSFLETGRSRPGRQLVLRLAVALALPLRERNALLRAAGLEPEFAERAVDEAAAGSIASTLRSLLDHHQPYPGSAHDPTGKVVMANAAFFGLFPDATRTSAEAAVDRFFAQRGHLLHLKLENWAEVAWAYADRWRLRASRSADAEVARLCDRVHAHLEGVDRPEPSGQDSAIISPRFVVDGRRITVFSTFLRFDTAREVTLSELCLELIHPADEESARFLRRLTAPR